MGIEIRRAIPEGDEKEVGSIDLSPLFERINQEARKPFRAVLEKCVQEEFERLVVDYYVTDAVRALLSPEGVVRFFVREDNNPDAAGASADASHLKQIAAVQQAVNTLFRFTNRERFSTGMQPYNPYPQLQAAQEQHERDARKEHPNPKIWRRRGRRALLEAAEKRREEFMQQQWSQLADQLNTEEDQRWEAAKTRFVREYVLTDEPEFNITAQRIAILLEDNPEKKEQQQLRAASRILIPFALLTKSQVYKVVIDNYETGEDMHEYILVYNEADKTMTLFEESESARQPVATLHCSNPDTLQDINIHSYNFALTAGQHAGESDSEPAIHGITLEPSNGYIMIATQQSLGSAIVDWIEQDDDSY